MRVLHLHSGNQFGGIERLLVTLAHLGAESGGVQHVFALCFRERLWRELEGAGAHAVWVGRARLARPDTILRVRHAARRLVAELTPDVVITHLPWTRVVFGPVLEDLAGRTVHWVHGCSARPRFLDRASDRHAADAYVYNSLFTASVCAGRYAGVRSRVLYYPVRLSRPAETRESVRARCATALADRVVVQASRMERWKGHFDLVNAAMHLPVELPWVIWFVGGPQTIAQKRYYERLQEHVAHSGLAMRVRFLGELSDVSSVLHASDVFCQPNELPEPFGIAFIEAMSAGLPVVATAIGAAPELVSDDTGTLVGPHDPAALAQAIQSYLADSTRRHEAGARGRVRAQTLADPFARLAELTSFLTDVRTGA